MTTDLKPFLMGSETEYAISGRAAGRQLDADEVYDGLAGVLRERRSWMADRGGYRGMYLQHGGRLYLDYGAHPEHATPECFTPAQVACYDKAGEALLGLARTHLLAAGRAERIAVVKNNLDPLHPDQFSYGTHESYTCWVPADAAGPQLLPHLASRLVYAGAGGLSGHAGGVGFELSQRARHLVKVTGYSTTGDRALFSTRIRKESDYSSAGWTRVHLIGKDSQRAPFGIYLTFATTGLLIQMLNQGLKVGKGLLLEDPIKALRDISRDPWLRVKVPLADGRKLTALEIQESYLAECEQAVQHGGLPEWAPEALRHWRQTLEDLRQDPLRLARRLDTYCKLLIYEHELLRAGYEWDDLRLALAKLNLLRLSHKEEVVPALVAEDPSRLSAEAAQDYALARGEVSGPGELERLRFAVRLQALDVHYHELGGLYDRLYAAGRMEGVVVSSADVERATREAPAGGRAAARGAFIASVNGESDWLADWQYLWHEPSGRCLDLRDPFSGESRLVNLPLPPEDDDEDEDYRPDVLELLAAQQAATA
jgi:proteasome accessory factor A